MANLKWVTLKLTWNLLNNNYTKGKIKAQQGEENESWSENKTSCSRLIDRITTFHCIYWYLVQTRTKSCSLRFTFTCFSLSLLLWNQFCNATFFFFRLPNNFPTINCNHRYYNYMIKGRSLFCFVALLIMFSTSLRRSMCLGSQKAATCIRSFSSTAGGKCRSGFLRKSAFVGVTSATALLSASSCSEGAATKADSFSGTNFFPPASPIEKGMLAVSDIHTIAYR